MYNSSMYNVYRSSFWPTEDQIMQTCGYLNLKMRSMTGR